jgi:putrescine---pyruvate transaminase
MHAVDGRELVIARGEGVFLWDREGRRYVDGSSSLWYANVGHGRREIADAVTRQLAKLETFHIFGDFANEPSLELAERLASLAPQSEPKVFLTSGGGDSIETAVKLARLHHAARGEPSRQHDSAQVSWDSLSALEAEIDRVGAAHVAAFVFEPVIGSGGVHVPPAGYLEGAQALCRRHGILSIADAVICGFGRLGTWFGVERFHLEPDLIVFAKGVTSGYLPLGGVVVARDVAAPFWSGRAGSFAHGTTYSGHATCCAAALANLDILERDGLVSRARVMEQSFAKQLSALAGHPCVGEVRGGVGLMAAIALREDLRARDASVAVRLWELAREAGVLTRGLFDGLAIAPPLCIHEEETALIVHGLGEALDALAREI